MNCIEEDLRTDVTKSGETPGRQKRVSL